jgi:transcriptional regulator of acetoin/glycerol metabolism
MTISVPRAAGDQTQAFGTSHIPDAPSVGDDPQMVNNLALGIRLFDNGVPILLKGATGTGKKVLAKALHCSSRWADKPFIAINCAAIPLRPRFKQAAGGTLFLDNVADLSLTLQGHLLHIIDNEGVTPRALSETRPVGMRVISATYRDLRRMIRDGQFREDLYYRLNGLTLHLPLLRERSDLAGLIRDLLEDENTEARGIKVAEDALRMLMEYSWPGNIRQLRNALRSALALCADGIIRAAHLPRETLEEAASPHPPLPDDGNADAHAELSATTGAALRRAEREALLDELNRWHWNISSTAKTLGISRNTLHRKIRKHQISRDRCAI